MVDHYKANVRDILFILLEWSGTRERLGTTPFEELDEDVVRDLVAQAAKLAEGRLAESFTTAERDPVRFDPATGEVRIPPAMRASYDALRAAEFWRLDAPRELGGQPAPRTLAWALNELFVGANPPVQMALSWPAFAGVVHRNGTAAQRQLTELIVERGWGMTMVLTEDGAGSDLAAIRTRAVPQPDGSWHIEGAKRFITNGEHDYADNIVHLVLARPIGAQPGTKGLSLFLVPKYHVNLETGETGERNGVVATGLEHKMGLVGSPTCELRFGERADRPAVGWLLGETHAGIVQMFQVITHSRLSVGTKALAALSTGYLNALDFARHRVQGADIARAADPAAPRVTILRHPEIRQNLMLAKGYAEGLRALIAYTAGLQDDLALAPHDEADGPPAEIEARLQLLLPVVKGVASERAYEQLSQLLGVLGGSGFLRDYPLEQYVRDTRIDAIYEGTTAIQGQDLFLRRIARDGGRAFTALVEEILKFADGVTETELAGPSAALREAVAEVQGTVEVLLGRVATTQPEELRRTVRCTTLLLLTVGDLLVAYLLVSQAHTALRALASTSGPGETFYRGKVAAARHFTSAVLPEFAGRRRVLEGVDTELMELDPAVL